MFDIDGEASKLGFSSKYAKLWHKKQSNEKTSTRHIIWDNSATLKILESSILFTVHTPDSAERSLNV